MGYLCSVYLIPSINTTTQFRAGLMLAQIVLITSNQFKLRNGAVFEKVQNTVIDMLWQQRRQGVQLFGVQIGCKIYAENKVENNLIFNNLIRILQISKFKDVRKMIIKLVKVPDFYNKKENVLKQKLKHILTNAIGLRLMD